MTGNDGLVALIRILNEVGTPYMQDVIVQKLRWAKGGTRSKDFDDVVAILGVQETVDFTYRKISRLYAL
jgi:hypothetical protein